MVAVQFCLFILMEMVHLTLQTRYKMGFHVFSGGRGFYLFIFW